MYNQFGGDNYSQAGNFSGTQFGNSGGFVNDGDKFAGSQSNYLQSSQSPSAARKRDEQSLVPVTIKQCKSVDGGEAKLKIDSKPINQITFVGVVLSTEQQPTNVTYLMDDGSEKIYARLYSDSDLEARIYESGTYLRVIGNLKNINGSLNVVAHQLLPIEDFNEVTYHAAEVMKTHIRNVSASNGGNQHGNMGMQMNGMQGNNQMNQNNMIKTEGGVVGSDGFSNNASANTGGNNIQESVMKIFSMEDPDDNGTHVDHVCQQLSHIPRTDILQAIEFLTDEGHLYSTVDEQHFKSTAAQ